jgi:hypothetical protein
MFLDITLLNLTQSTERTQVNKHYDILSYLAVNLNVKNKQLRSITKHVDSRITKFFPNENY